MKQPDIITLPRAGAKPVLPELVTPCATPAARDDVPGPNSEFDSRDGGQSVADTITPFPCGRTFNESGWERFIADFHSRLKPISNAPRKVGNEQADRDSDAADAPLGIVHNIFSNP